MRRESSRIPLCWFTASFPREFFLNTCHGCILLLMTRFSSSLQRGKKKELVLAMRVDGENRAPLYLAEKRKEDYSIIV